jgi:hypothetical protein
MSEKKPARKKVVKRVRRLTAQVFDGLFKQLLRLSGKAVGSFINGLFGTKHPLNSKVDHLDIETTIGKRRRKLRDAMLRINSGIYHVEVEANKKPGMAIRMFLYSFDEGVSKNTSENNVRTIEFANARIINLQETKKTPEHERILIKNPGSPDYDYKVKNFNLLSYSAKELEEMGLAILLPFYVLKLREQIKKAKPGLERKKFSPKLAELLGELTKTVNNCRRKGVIDKKDEFAIIEAIDFLSIELYGQYKELAEDNIMLREKFFETYDDVEKRGAKQKSLEIAKNLLADGLSPERVAKNTGVSLSRVKALLKTTTVKQIA